MRSMHGTRVHVVLCLFCLCTSINYRCVYVYVCLRACVCVHVCVCVHMYTGVCMCMCVYMHVYVCGTVCIRPMQAISA